MSSQPEQTRSCPTCGTPVLDVARYCPNCGTRLNPDAAFTADAFSDVLSDVLDVPDEESTESAPTLFTSSEAPTTALPQITPEPNPEPYTTDTEWTATTSGWSTSPGQAGTWSAEPPGATTVEKPRGRRTMWIILAILGFIVFCCCGSFFGLLLVAESDTAFQDEISRFAVLLAGPVIRF